MRSICIRFLTSAAIGLLLAGCGGGGGGSGGSTPSVSPSAPPVVVPVNGTLSLVMNAPWTDTGMMLEASSRVTITATGKFNRETGSCGGTCVTAPAGVPWSVCATQPAPSFNAPGLPCWSLIAKIGLSGKPFYVGDVLSFTPAQAGELYLGINDNYFPDDTGNWSATITKS